MRTAMLVRKPPSPLNCASALQAFAERFLEAAGHRVAGEIACRQGFQGRRCGGCGGRGRCARRRRGRLTGGADLLEHAVGLGDGASGLGKIGRQTLRRDVDTTDLQRRDRPGRRCFQGRNRRRRRWGRRLSGRNCGGFGRSDRRGRGHWRRLMRRRGGRAFAATAGKSRTCGSRRTSGSSRELVGQAVEPAGSWDCQSQEHRGYPERRAQTGISADWKVRRTGRLESLPYSQSRPVRVASPAKTCTSNAHAGPGVRRQA